eukprot:122259-Pelagomonas_calceolata.AAC.3
MQQCGGTYMPAVAVVEATKKQMERGRHVVAVQFCGTYMPCKAHGAKKVFPVLAGVAMRLLCMHSTHCASAHDWSAWGQLYTTKYGPRLALKHARKLIYVRCNRKQFILRRMTWKLAAARWGKQIVLMTGTVMTRAGGGQDNVIRIVNSF